jgi:hypothetical protein
VKTISNKLAAAVLGVALSMIGGVVAAEEFQYPRLPGEPPVQPATPGKLSEGDAINLAVNWAKFGKEPNANAFIDTAITAITIGYPPAGIALGMLKGLFTALSSGPDPVAEALKVMDKRIAALEKNVSQLAQALIQMNNKVLKIENNIRMLELQRRIGELANLKGDLAVLRERTPSPREKAEFTAKVVRLASRYRPDNSEPDADMWLWSDLKVRTDQATGKLVGDRMNPDFKTTPLLEAYGNALVLLMAAIQYENGSLAYIKATYHDELMRHVQALSVRPYWLEGQTNAGGALDEQSLPEMLMNRVSCSIGGFGKYPDKNLMCSAGYANCSDLLARKTKVVESSIPDWRVQSSNTLCTPATNLATGTMRPADRENLQALWEQRSDRAPWGSEALLRVRQYTGYEVPAEEIIEEFHGLTAMTELADRLYRLAVSGTLADPPQYSFDHTYWDKEYLYGVKKNGELIWFGHLIGEDRNPKKDNEFLKERLSTKLDSAVSAYATSDATAATKTRGIGNAGVIARTSPSASISRQMTAPAPSVNSKTGPVMTAADAARAKVAGTVVVPPDFPIIHKWEGPKTVGSGWQNFRDIIPAAMTDVTPNVGAASFYAVTTDGALVWYRHDGFVYGEPRWKGPVKVGSGWGAFTKIVPAGDGVLYGIGNDGTLRWYRQNDVADPSTQGPMGIGGAGTTRSSLGGVRQMIAAAPSHFTGPNVVGTGWGHFVHVFSTGEGVVYAVDPEGKLWWYKHRGYLTGTQEWEGPKQVGTGWAGFKKVFSSSEGYIYALQPSGDLLWYQHRGYQDGTVKWRGPTTIGATWGDYAFVFSAMAGTPRAPVVR